MRDCICEQIGRVYFRVAIGSNHLKEECFGSLQSPEKQLLRILVAIVSVNNKLKILESLYVSSGLTTALCNGHSTGIFGIVNNSWPLSYINIKGMEVHQILHSGLGLHSYKG